MDVVLRTATPADHDLAAALDDLGDATARLLRDDLAPGAPRHVVVATPVVEPATVCALAMTTRSSDEVHLLDLVVALPHRRAGLARRLLGELAHRAAVDGATAMTLEVRTGNAPARALYAAAGFTDVGARPGYYADGEDARILWHHDLPALADG